MDNLGRFVISKEMRDRLGLEPNEMISIKLFDNHIEISKPEWRCTFCNTPKDIVKYNNHSICKSCLDDLVEKFSE